jgi:gamma-carbonic anhydrase
VERVLRSLRGFVLRNGERSMFIQNPMNLVLPESLFGGGLVLPYLDHAPEIGQDVFIAPTASVIGQARLGDKASIWFGAVLRGDIARVEVGEGSNVQDNSVLHVGDEDPCIVGKNVVIGHNVILHGCTVEDDCLIGMGAIVLNKAVVGKGSVVGAGALVTQNMVIPPYSMVIGSPAKVRRELTDEERRHNAVFGPKYTRVAENYRPFFKP